MRYESLSKTLAFCSSAIKKLNKCFLKNILIFLCIACVVVSTFLIMLKNELPNLNLNMKMPPKTFDPRKAGDVFSCQMISLLFEGLVKRYPDGSIQLAQAKSYKLSDNKLTYTFILGDNLWSNGKPITAYDFEQSWKDILDPTFPSTGDYQFAPIKNAESAKKGFVSLSEVGIKAVDEKILVIELEHPTPHFLKLLATARFSPINVEQDRKNPKWANQLESQFICNGPFILESFKQGKIVFTSNPHYRKTKDKHPKKITFNIVENDYVTLEMFKQGRIDMIGDSLTTIPLEKISELEKKWTFNLEPRPYSVLIYLNTTKQPFNNAKIRRAFALAINRQELLGLLGKSCKKNIKTDFINLAYQSGLCTTNLVPPCLKENRCPQFFKGNDIVQANVLLNEGMAELGITKEAFKALTFLYSSRVYGADELVQIIQQQLAKAFGIFIKLEKLDFSTTLDKLDNKDYSMCLVCWFAFYDDPMDALQKYKYKNYRRNYTGWENPKFIELINRSNYEEGDKRLLTLEEAERVLIRDMPAIPLYHRNYVYLMNPELEVNFPLRGDRILFPMSPEQKKVQEEK